MTIEGNEGVGFIAAAVVVGVLIRDTLLETSPPDEEILPSQIIHNGNYTHLCEIIGSLLLKEINREREGKLKQVFFCQLLKAYLRLHSRAVDRISEEFVSLFGSVVVFMKDDDVDVEVKSFRDCSDMHSSCC